MTTPNKDLHSQVAVADVFGPVSIDADNTPAAIDLLGYGAAEIILGVGIGGITFDASNKIEVKLTASDDNVTYVAVTADEVLGEASIGTGGIIKSLVAAHAAAAWYRYGYVGGKRYIKVLADFTGTHGAATPLACCVIKGRPLLAPVDADA